MVMLHPLHHSVLTGADAYFLLRWCLSVCVLVPSVTADAPAVGTEGVDSVPLDAVRLPPGVCPRLIKVDVEGMEVSVLRGASRLLTHCK